MSIVTITSQVTSSNTKTFTNKKGEEQLILNVMILKGIKDADVKPIYAKAFLPTYIEIGDIVTVSGEIKVTQSGKYVNYDFNFPTVSKAFIDDGQDFGSQQQAEADLFGETEQVDVADDDLPF